MVQDLRIRPHVVNFRRERWQGPNGATMTAPLPDGISGHFGPELRRFVLVQYHQGQVTMPRLWALLRSFGILISKRQLVRLLIAGQDDFLDEARDVLRTGLSSAAWITVDDTGARHKAANGFCTQVGNAHFAWFGTTGSKSRANFLELLRAGHVDYVINAEALAYMRQRALAGPLIARLAEHRRKSFADRAAWTVHLDRLGISALKSPPRRRRGSNPDPMLIATEGALWGSVKAHGFLPDTVIVSDDAGQFNVGQHGLCWVHAERLVHKLDTFTHEQRAAQCRSRETVGAAAEVHRLGRHQNFHARRNRDHVAAFTARNTSRSQAGSTPGVVRTTAPPISIVIVAQPWPDAPERHSFVAKLRHDRNEQRCLVGRQAQQAAACRLAPSEQMLRRDVVPARHLRHNRARRIGFRHDPALGFIAPATPPPRSDLDIDPAPWSRSFNHMVDHICNSTSRMWAASCRAARALQGGGGKTA